LSSPLLSGILMVVVQVGEMRYSGFLSYSRRDQVVANWLNRRLDGWRPPRHLRRQTGIERIRIFRDIEDAELGELSDVIRRALEASDHLILLCSPASRQSTYVALEIETFAAAHGSEKILPVLVGGRPNKEVAPDDPCQDQAFSEALLSLYEEPLAADLRPRPGESRAKRREREREAFFQIVARLLNVPKSDELVRRDRMQRRLRAIALSAFLLISVVGGGWAWWDAREKAGLDPVWRLTGMTLEPRDAATLDRLESALAAAIPAKRPDNRLLIATWNIREFRSREEARLSRGPEDFTLVAAILSRFDIVAVQELKGYEPDFAPARDAVLSRLGRHWAYVGSGVTEGSLGNLERLGFFYDRRAVKQEGGIDELVLAPEVMEETGLDRQVARTPISADFDFGNRTLRLVNAHIVWGQTEIEREREFEAILRTLHRMGERDDTGATVLLGDLNFSNPEVPQVAIAAEFEFRFPPGLLAAGTSMNSDRPYDQIILGWNPNVRTPSVSASGVFPVFAHIYRDEDLSLFRDRLETVWPGEEDRLDKLYRAQWRTRKISDHRPKWVEFDFAPAN
jgi:endonuclease/exonuclease/phosphatase family metal-dependent hydrolase